MRKIRKNDRAAKKKKYEKPELIEIKLDAPEAANYLTAIFVGTALTGCGPACS